ncbi:MAG: DUF4041 domain-containing protein [Acidimicrobiia bacterium]|nr:DUF4041 domain-containing protein [Acidimicrobiia bacterium]
MTTSSKHLLPPAQRLATHPRKRYKGSRTQLVDEISRLYKFVDDYQSLLPNGYTDMVTKSIEIEAALGVLTERQNELNQAINTKQNELANLVSQIVETRDVMILQEVGIYDYSHPMESSAEYKTALGRVRQEMKSTVKDGYAVSVGTTTWTVDGSAAKGKKMVRDMSKLLLRAYNNEASTLVSKLRPFRLEAALKRLETSRNVINRLGAKPMQIAISINYHRLRREELRLTADWLAKKEEEKEAAKAERQRLREEAKARREIEAERKRLFRERKQYRAVLEKLRRQGADDGDAEVAELEEKLTEIGDAILTVEDRVANTRAGYVYVISNIGSFGEKMVKIGMTRRLEPLDRVRELGDASVPFRYDLHMMAFSDDAVTLERELHEEFASRRVNLVNLRREFFYATPAEVRQALEENSDWTAYVTEFIEDAEAIEWHTSENSRPS